MFSRLFGRKKNDDAPHGVQQVPLDASWSFLGADMHSHMIPGIDDGAKTIEDSVTMLRALKELGYNTVITTPHIMSDFYPNTRQTIEAGLMQVQQALKENNIDLTLRAAAEYYIDEYFIQLIEQEPLLTVHKNEVLVEFSMLYEPPMLFEAIYKLQSSGYKPIIAHPERYLFFHREFGRYEEFRDRGCLLQMNMLAITGHYGRNIKSIADKLLSKGMYDYCGTDMHHERHVAAMKTILSTKDYLTFVNYPFLNSRLCNASEL